MQQSSALIDTPTSAVLFLTPQIPFIVFLEKAMPETEHAVAVQFPNYLRDFPVARAPPATYPEWTWDGMSRVFSPTPANLVTEQLRQRSTLAIKKAQLLSEVITGITMSRYAAWSGVPMQEVVYVTKRRQAQRYKDAGYPEDDLLSYPYVLQYADLSGLTMRAAADEILLKASLEADLLLKTEYFRLKYFDRIKKINDVGEVDRFIFEFRQEFLRSFTVDYAVRPL